MSRREAVGSNSAAGGGGPPPPAYRPQGLHQVAFPLQKGADELRLFALGGSTTQGMPFDLQEQGFPERVRKLLEARHPDTTWRMINLGVGGLDSHEFPDQTRELAKLDGDGLLIYAGNNELVGALVHQCSEPFRQGLERWLNRVRLLRLGRSWWRATHPDAQVLDAQTLQRHQTQCAREEVARILAEDQQRALRAGRPLSELDPEGEAPWTPRWPQRTDAFYLRVLSDFQRNMERVLELAEAEGMQVWLALPPLNYLAAPHYPAASMDLPAEEREQLRRLLERAARLQEHGEGAQAAPLLEQALELDPSHAETCYRLGLLELEAGDQQRARSLLQRAADRDYEGNRISSDLTAVLRHVCQEHPAIHCVDLRAEFEQRSPAGVPRDDLFVDFCHPTFEAGVETIAEAFAAPISDWKQTR